MYEQLGVLIKGGDQGRLFRGSDIKKRLKEEPALEK